MPVNVKLLKKVRKLIAEEPRRLNMRKWGWQHNKQSVSLDPTLPPCGTVACLAGHIILAAKPKREWPKLFNRKGDMRIATRLTPDGDRNMAAVRAAKLIGIDERDCPFGEIRWGKSEVLAWIDRQIDAASK